MTTKVIKRIDEVTIRFAGDSGDGMQLTGTRFTETTAIQGNDLRTLPNYPAEIRAPAGTLAGVSAFQLNFSSHAIYTPGDSPDVLVAMNPAALKVHLKDLKRGGVILANANAYTDRNLKLANWDSNPLEDESLDDYDLYSVEMTKLVTNALEDSGLSSKDIERTKNMFALGLLFWMYNRSMDSTITWLEEKFKNAPEIAKANIAALKTGYNYGDTTEIFTTTYRVDRAEAEPGRYKSITGNDAVAYGFVAAANQAGKELFLGSYPITPASEILHALSALRNFGVKTFQAEDEIAGISSAIGASFAGDLAITTTSGPGLALKSEAIGLAVMTELPLVIVDVQRGGPSTGLPTKTEQSDLMQAIYGRNGEAPVPVIAAQSPTDCFDAAFEAAQVAFKYMTPVLLLSDGYLGLGSEPWRIPDPKDLPKIDVKHPDKSILEEDGVYKPYLRDEKTLARPWAIPGTPGLEHRIGGLEKEDVTGNVNYEPLNHEKMIHLRDEKIKRVANEYAPTQIYGNKKGGKLLVIGWGSTFGSIHVAVERAREKGYDVSQVHLRWVYPLPNDLESVLDKFEQILIPEVNLGQLIKIFRMNFQREMTGLDKIQGQPFKASEIEAKIYEMLG
ncbi:MAG: 2-oxoacid:acceptor oxidoreductase subunit alpha [Candidatus Marinimicrobia bacterium]|nr:2-oxoacid:acceptor oxidoreductase subunit alpha [Candidatus Neomarinimicrobiota bacterium]MCF7840094.1 2-oxoacid:acceptor oxidoreductase subunit alpha [Candidatus Neomarinimicrobiota bacterium]MCF7902725.1 2-oxoacid:acceptor oxidoreductase subunit alpha [Candidatus Neomarinimicrobiota bacterium]